MREELLDLLHKAGYQADGISDFEDVAGQVLGLSPDLALLDLNLPGASGFQVCRELKQKSAVPVLVLPPGTSYGTNSMHWTWGRMNT